MSDGIFHVHSSYSSDGRLSLETLREECVKRKLAFMVVTDHAEDFPSGTDGVKKFVTHCDAVSGNNFWVIPGLEFVIDKERAVHLLVVGLNALPLDDGVEGILKTVLEQETDAFTVLAHPSRSDYYIPPDYEEKIDGIEVWNAAYDTRYLPDQRTLRFFFSLLQKNPGLIGFGGLDLHDRPGFRGVHISVTDPWLTISGLLDLLKRGRFTIRRSPVELSSVPKYGFLGMTVLRLGRKVLSMADFLAMKSPVVRRLYGLLRSP